MEDVIQFLAGYEIWIYVILGAIGLVYLRRLFKAINDWRDAAFGLEREIAQRQFLSSMTALVLLFVFALSEFFLVSYATTRMPSMQSIATPTIDVFVTSTATLPVETEAIPGQVETEPTQTPIPEGCVPGQIEITSPEPGEQISEMVNLIGTVNIPNFGFYKYEYTEPGNTIWKTIAGGNAPVIDGEIGDWNTSQVLPGDYLLRLVVLDNTNKEYPACVVPVRVINQ